MQWAAGGATLVQGHRIRCVPGAHGGSAELLPDDIRRDLLDRAAFTFTHRLMGHPALSLRNLGRVIPALPAAQEFHSSGRLQRGDNFDRAHVEHATDLSIEETMGSIRSTDAHIMVRAAETDASLQPLFHDLLADAQDLMRERRVGHEAHGATLYLFIASPGSETPFHIDRYSTTLMQFQGTQEVTVFPQWDDRVVAAAAREGFVAHTGDRPAWQPQAEPLGTTFRFAPGDALHIPFEAGQHVRNGPGEVSISMSIICNTAETLRRVQAMVLNSRLWRLGLSPAPVSRRSWRDATKAAFRRGSPGWPGGCGEAVRPAAPAALGAATGTDSARRPGDSPPAGRESPPSCVRCRPGRSRTAVATTVLLHGISFPSCRTDCPSPGERGIA